MGMDKAGLRRSEDDLYVSGMGVMVMGAWSVIKAVMELGFGSDEQLFPGVDNPDKGMTYMVITAVIVAILVALILKLHFYIGLNAVRAAQGKPYKKGYYTAAIIMLVVNILGMLFYKNMFKKPENIDTSLASMLVDLTTIYIFVIVIKSSNILKKHTKEQIGSNG